MSNSPPPDSKKPPRDREADVLAALHRLSSGEAEPASGEGAGSGSGILSASGFVGMLAKGQTGDTDALDLGPAPPSQPPSPPPTPQPVPVEEAPGGRGPEAEPLLPAEEMAAAAAPVTGPGIADSGIAGPAALPAVRRSVRRPVPHWYRVITPLSYTISSLLLLVGLWAIPASIYILTEWKWLAGFPLVPRLYDSVTEEPTERNFMFYIPCIMLLCLPLALALGAMAVVMSRQIRAYDRARAERERPGG